MTIPAATMTAARATPNLFQEEEKKSLVAQIADGLSLTDGVMAPLCAAGMYEVPSMRRALGKLTSNEELARVNLGTFSFISSVLRMAVDRERVRAYTVVLGTARARTRLDAEDHQTRAAEWFLGPFAGVDKDNWSDTEDLDWLLLLNDMPVFEEDVVFSVVTDLMLHVAAVLQRIETLGAAQKALLTTHVLVTSYSPEYLTRAAFVEAMFSMCNWTAVGVDVKNPSFIPLRSRLIGFLSANADAGIRDVITSVAFGDWFDQSGIKEIIFAEVVVACLGHDLASLTEERIARCAPSMMAARSLLIDSRTPRLFNVFPTLAALAWIHRTFVLDSVSMRFAPAIRAKMPAGVADHRREEVVSLYTGDAVRAITETFDRNTLLAENLLSTVLSGLVPLSTSDTRGHTLDVSQVGGVSSNSTGVFAVRYVFFMPTTRCAWNTTVYIQGAVAQDDQHARRWGWGNDNMDPKSARAAAAGGASSSALVVELRLRFVHNTLRESAGNTARIQFNAECTFFRRGIQSTALDQTRLNLRTPRDNGMALSIVDYSATVMHSVPIH